MPHGLTQQPLCLQAGLPAGPEPGSFPFSLGPLRGSETRQGSKRLLNTAPTKQPIFTPVQGEGVAQGCPIPAFISETGL